MLEPFRVALTSHFKILNRLRQNTIGLVILCILVIINITKYTVIQEEASLTWIISIFLLFFQEYKIIPFVRYICKTLYHIYKASGSHFCWVKGVTWSLLAQSDMLLQINFYWINILSPFKPPCSMIIYRIDLCVKWS